MQFKACNSLTLPNSCYSYCTHLLSTVLTVLRQWGSCQGNLMPGVSVLDVRRPASVSLFWSHGKGLGRYPEQQAKGGESLVHSCCAISLNEAILTGCKLATPVSQTSAFHVSNLSCTGIEVLCGGPDIFIREHTVILFVSFYSPLSPPVSEPLTKRGVLLSTLLHAILHPSHHFLL
jgi:hypothetical protein